ncbi:MAG: heparinase II/III family protein [Acidobacteria bacterium]|nr:heparinase II/III family protein [Acidobacteriota bacterium]
MNRNRHDEWSNSMRVRSVVLFGIILLMQIGSGSAVQTTGRHPGLLYDSNELTEIRKKAASPVLKPVAQKLIERAEKELKGGVLIPSITGRGEPDPQGESKGLSCARKLQVRVLTYAMAFNLSGDRKYRDAAVRELLQAIDDWRIWVDTAHPPPYDLMTGENSLTFGLAWDWLYHDLTVEERNRLREGVERRALRPYLDAAGAKRPPSFFKGLNNWNPVCNGGAAVLALALEGESALASDVLKIAVPAMDYYWGHLADDGGWDEGTGYWTYGHRYAFIAAEALRRAGKPGGAERFKLPGAMRTGYFPIVFNPGRKITAGFGDSNSRANDAIFYLLGREYRNPDYIWFQDMEMSQSRNSTWPVEALSLIWRPVGERWLPEAKGAYKPKFESVYLFSSIGWGMMASNQPDPALFLAFKNGSLAANHTHIDLNTINIGYGETMLAVELGSRPYPADYFSSKRSSYYEITTAGHNTVLIGGKGQAPKKIGRITGPLQGDGFDALVGVADSAYEVDAPRVRRHAVFVDKRYWVLLDEIQTTLPETAELRFHTYAKVTESKPRQWVFEQDQAALDVFSPEQEISVSTEQPGGWIKPVTVLSLKAPSDKEHAIVTVLQPRSRGAKSFDLVKVQKNSDEIKVVADADQVIFKKSPEGWQVLKVIVKR